MSLLSPWVWAIHIASVSEWTLAIILLWNYAGKMARPDLRRMSLAMLPHWGAGMCVLAWHFNNDTPNLPLLPRMQEFLTSVGSVSLCLTAVSLREWRARFPRFSATVAGLGVVAIAYFSYLRMTTNYGGATGMMIQGAGMAYLAFIIFLIINRRWDKDAFNPVAITGYALIIFFIVTTISLTIVARKYFFVTSVTQVDWLHGIAEGTMTIANTTLALGILRNLRRISNVRESIPDGMLSPGGVR